MNFLQDIFASLAAAPERVVLEEMRPERRVSATAKALLERIAAARAFLTAAGLRKGDRCALLGAEQHRLGGVGLGRHGRGNPGGAALRAASARGACRHDSRRSARHHLLRRRRVASGSCSRRTRARHARCCWKRSLPRQGPRAARARVREPVALADSDPVTIIYTSGTSGESKGVVLNAGNVTYMLSCTMARLDLLMGKRAEADRVFHYLPFCFAGSWILLLTSLLRTSELRLCTDLSRLADDLREATPDYCLNVPQLLERMRSAVEAQIAKRGGILNKIFAKAKAASLAPANGAGGGISLLLAQKLIFPAIRKKLGPKLKALICGSAPLALETQLFFEMLGIPVLQVYGLTETTAICTMDDPAARRSGHRGAGHSRNRDEAGRERRNSGARAEHFSRLLESAGRDSQSAGERLVPHGRSGRANFRRQLAHHRARKEFADPQLGP